MLENKKIATGFVLDGCFHLQADAGKFLARLSNDSFIQLFFRKVFLAKAYVISWTRQYFVTSSDSIAPEKFPKTGNKVTEDGR